jgi:hypothetical protein
MTSRFKETNPCLRVSKGPNTPTWVGLKSSQFVLPSNFPFAPLFVFSPDPLDRVLVCYLDSG